MLPDASSIRRLRRRDPLLAAAMDRTPAFPGFPDAARRRASCYESIAKAIVFQQLAGKAASTIWGRVRALGANGRLPAPPELLALPEDVLRSAGLSRGKLAALRDLAERIDDGRLSLRGIHRLSDEEVVDALVDVEIVQPDGSRVKIFPDGTRSSVSIQGAEIQKDGTRVLVHEDGSKTILRGDGGVERVFPDGTKTTLKTTPDKAPETKEADPSKAPPSEP